MKCEKCAQNGINNDTNKNDNNNVDDNQVNANALSSRSNNITVTKALKRLPNNSYSPKNATLNI